MQRDEVVVRCSSCGAFGCLPWLVTNENGLRFCDICLPDWMKYGTVAGRGGERRAANAVPTAEPRR